MAENKNEARLLSRDEQAKNIEQEEKAAAKAEYAPRTAQEIVATVGAVQGDNEKEKAREAGVVSVEYINYDEALKNYEARADVEPLAERRARENGTSFSEANFRREISAVDNSGLVTTDTAPAGKSDTVVKDEAKAKS